MASLNRVLLIGNLTRDPELRYIPSGQPVTTFTIAVNRVYNSQSGERKEEVSFVRIVAWGRQAETCNEYLKKGSPVFVEGRLQSRSWEAQDGTKRSTIEVVAQNVQFLSSRSSKSSDIPVQAEEDASIFEEAQPSEEPSAGKSSSKSSGYKADDDIPF